MIVVEFVSKEFRKSNMSRKLSIDCYFDFYYGKNDFAFLPGQILMAILFLPINKISKFKKVVTLHYYLSFPYQAWKWNQSKEL